MRDSFFYYPILLMVLVMLFVPAIAFAGNEEASNKANDLVSLPRATLASIDENSITETSVQLGNPVFHIYKQTLDQIRLGSITLAAEGLQRLRPYAAAYDIIWGGECEQQLVNGINSGQPADLVNAGVHVLYADIQHSVYMLRKASSHNQELLREQILNAKSGYELIAKRVLRQKRGRKLNYVIQAHLQNINALLPTDRADGQPDNWQNEVEQLSVSLCEILTQAFSDSQAAVGLPACTDQ